MEYLIKTKSMFRCLMNVIFGGVEGYYKLMNERRDNNLNYSLVLLR